MTDKTAFPASILKVEDFIRGQRVIIDRDLARLYGKHVKHLNEQVKRNKDRFPNDFMFQLSSDEKSELVANCDQFEKLKHSSALPYAFTEHGAIMAASVLNSEIAVETSVLVVRAFVRARQIIAEHSDLKNRLDELERKIIRRFSEHEIELMEIRFTIQQLMQPLEPSDKQLVGFRRKKAD